MTPAETAFFANALKPFVLFVLLLPAVFIKRWLRGRQQNWLTRLLLREWWSTAG